MPALAALWRRGIMADLRASVGTKGDGPGAGGHGGPALSPRRTARASAGPARGQSSAAEVAEDHSGRASGPPSKSKKTPPSRTRGVLFSAFQASTFFGISDTTPPVMASSGVKATGIGCAKVFLRVEATAGEYGNVYVVVDGAGFQLLTQDHVLTALRVLLFKLSASIGSVTSV